MLCGSQKFLCLPSSNSRTLWWHFDNAWGYTSIPCNKKEYIFHRGCSWSVQSILSGLIPGRKESDKALHAVFVTPLNPFGENPDEEEHHDDYTVPQKVHCRSQWKSDQDAVCWITLSKVQDLGLQFWQTKSFTIITDNPVSGDCFFRVISESGDRPRPAPKVSLKSNWLVQHESICNEVETGTSKVVAKWESHSGTRDGTRDVKEEENSIWKQFANRFEF